MPIDRGMDKEDVVHIYIYIYNGVLPSHEKNEIMPFAAPWVDLKGIMLGEIS